MVNIGQDRPEGEEIMTSKKDSKRQATEPQPASTVQVPKAPNPETPIAKAAEPAPKQTQTFNRLVDAWKERKLDLSQMKDWMDGKYRLVVPTPAFPVIRIGGSGGIELPDLKSYPSAFQAAVDGDKLLAKQVARRQKKSVTPAPAPSKPQPAPAGKQESPAVRKQKEHNKLEAALA
jgi:hypothetical protein